MRWAILAVAIQALAASEPPDGAWREVEAGSGLGGVAAEAGASGGAVVGWLNAGHRRLTVLTLERPLAQAVLHVRYARDEAGVLVEKQWIGMVTAHRVSARHTEVARTTFASAPER